LFEQAVNVSPNPIRRMHNKNAFFIFSEFK
jgi:hypothetical protein